MYMWGPPQKGGSNNVQTAKRENILAIKQIAKCYISS